MCSPVPSLFVASMVFILSGLPDFPLGMSTKRATLHMDINSQQAGDLGGAKAGGSEPMRMDTRPTPSSVSWWAWNEQPLLYTPSTITFFLPQTPRDGSSWPWTKTSEPISSNHNCSLEILFSCVTQQTNVWFAQGYKEEWKVWGSVSSETRWKMPIPASQKQQGSLSKMVALLILKQL